jgi:hypothetical protein
VYFNEKFFEKNAKLFFSDNSDPAVNSVVALTRFLLSEGFDFRTVLPG